MGLKLKTIIGPSPVGYLSKKLINRVRGGSSQASEPLAEIDSYTFEFDEKDRQFFEEMAPDKPARLTEQELQAICQSKKTLTKDQRLIRSVLDEVIAARAVSEKSIPVLDLLYQYQLRRRYKNYLRFKRLIPVGVLLPFTNTELTRMSYASILGSRSLSLTLPGLIGYSLPAFVFCHMSSFYVPDTIKPIFDIGKFTLGAPVWLISTLTDKGLETIEEKTFGVPIPLDIPDTGGTIPSDLGSLTDLKKIVDEYTKKMGSKSY